MVIQLIINGLAMGFIYALAALGVVMLYNALGIVNFAQGEFATLGAFIAYSLIAEMGVPYPLGFIVTVLIAAAVGVLFERIVYRPLRHKHFLTVIVSTIGVMIFFREFERIVWKPIPRFFPDIFEGRLITIGNMVIVPQHMFIIGVALVLMVALYLFLNKTSVGAKMRATAQDQETASLMGIDVDKMIVLTFVISACLGAIPGILFAPIFFITTDMGGTVGLAAFCASIIGGFGSVPGAITGALLLGLVEVFAAAYISSVYKPAVAFALVIAFLLLRPEGIFGEKVSVKV